MATISGEVRDENGDLLANCVVRAYRRDTGALLVSGLSGDGTEEQPGDDDFASVALLLHCNGTDGSTTFTDNSPSPKTVTANGNAHVKTDQFKFGGASAYFDGSGDYLGLPNDASLNNFGTGDFTIECWAYPTSLSQNRMLLSCFSAWTASLAFAMQITSAGAPRVLAGNSAPIIIIGASASVSTNTWVHIAVCRASGTTRLFLNGSSVGTPHSGSVEIGNNSAPRIGIGSDNSDPFVGYVDDIRITKGVARYTENFTAPAGPAPDYTTIPARPLGEYTLSTTHTGEVQVVALDPDDGATLKDLILRTTPV